MGQVCASCCSDQTALSKEFNITEQITGPKLVADLGQKMDDRLTTKIKPHPCTNTVKIQRALRGYSAKKVVKSLKVATRGVREITSTRSDIRPVVGEITDYTNADVQRTLKQVGEFVYDVDPSQYGDVVEKPPMELESGSIFIGEWNMNDMRHGKGKQFWTDGSVYEGYWKDDQANGHGRLIHADGDYYEGHWTNDQANGKGKYVHSDGSQFEGIWKDDKQNGYGVEIWPDGACYKGNYETGQKHGMGEFSWADGSKYAGQFLDNNIHGNGTYTWADGRTYKGQWKDNKMDGMGEFTWTDGRKYNGNYINDKKEGYGIFQWPNMRRYEGNWKNGKQHGSGNFITEKGQKREGVWENGVRLHWKKSTPEAVYTEEAGVENRVDDADGQEEAIIN